VKPSERIDRIRQLIRIANNSGVNMDTTGALGHCASILQELVADVEELKRDQQYTGHRTAPIDDQSDPVHPLSQAGEPRREYWKHYDADGYSTGCMVELREGERIALKGEVVLTTKQAERVRKLYRVLSRIDDPAMLRWVLDADCKQTDHTTPPFEPGDYVLGFRRPGDIVLTAEQAERVRDLIAVVPRLRNVEVSDDEPVVEEILDAYSKLKVDDVAAFVGIEVDRERE
jgi:hypothetical protein